MKRAAADQDAGTGGGSFAGQAPVLALVPIRSVSSRFLASV